jgi:hypothetical protein
MNPSHNKKIFPKAERLSPCFPHREIVADSQPLMHPLSLLFSKIKIKIKSRKVGSNRHGIFKVLRV